MLSTYFVRSNCYARRGTCCAEPEADARQPACVMRSPAHGEPFDTLSIGWIDQNHKTPAPAAATIEARSSATTWIASGARSNPD